MKEATWAYMPKPTDEITPQYIVDMSKVLSDELLLKLIEDFSKQERDCQDLNYL